jgi:acyl carrier protein
MITVKEIASIISELYEPNIDLSKINDDTPLYPNGPFEMDSLDVLNLTITLEEKFDIELVLEKESTNSLSGLVNVINKKISEKEAMVNEA